MVKKSNKLTLDIFIERSINLWGHRWDYSKTTYKNSKDRLIITCREHGEFFQSAHNHMAGNCGCYKCRKLKPHLMTKTQEQFIEEAKSIWGDRWDYSKCLYLNSHKSVVIICREHGEFEQVAGRHLSGSYNCKKCKAKKEKEQSALIKFSISA